MTEQRAAPRLIAAIIVTSDRCFVGKAIDASGPLLSDLCRTEGIDPEPPIIVPDDVDRIRNAMVEASDLRRVDFVLTSGGTGVGPRDVTPEATLSAIDREVPGLAEAIRGDSRARVPAAMLSRGVAGLRGRTLIVNFPGSPAGAADAFRTVAPVLRHARAMIDGGGHEKNEQPN